MNFKRVAVLRGGNGPEYKLSMESGAAVLAALKDLDYQTKDIVITKNGNWLENGLTRRPEQALEAVDVVFIAVHGDLATGGELQKIINRLQIPYTGSSGLTAKIAQNKSLTKDLLKNIGIKTPKYRVVDRSDKHRLEQIVDLLNDALGEELFIKPVQGDSSADARFAPNKTTLKDALETLLETHERVLVEEFIRGKEATVAVMENYRNQPLYVLPAVEIVPPGGQPHYSFENKLEQTADQIVPGRFSYHEKAQLEDLARRIHQELRCQHFSRSDFIIKNGDIYFLEVNTQPNVAAHAPLYSGAQAIGMAYNDFIAFLVETAKR